MMLCSREAETATPMRPRILARRRQAPHHIAAASAAPASYSATAAASRRRRTASASNGVGADGRDGECCSELMVESLTEAVATKQNQLKAFADAMTKPVSSQESRRSFELLRALLPQRFAELCKVHLSFLIDVPADFLESDCESDGRKQQQQQPQATPGRWLRHHVRSSMKMKLQNGRADPNGGNTAEIPQPPIASTDLAVVESLLAQLCEHADSASEGLFRKCGSASRQRHLLDALRSGAGPAKASAAVSGCSPHDLAGALKSTLTSLGEPLLTDRLLPYFQQVARLGTMSAVGDEGRAALLAARRLKGFRLLVQLLPPDRRSLLGRLLALLARTGAAPETRMTPDSLGTVFGPALLYPRTEASAEGAREFAEVLNSAVAFLVRHSESVMMIPESIAQDADQILRRIRRSPTAVATAAAVATATTLGGPSEEVVNLSVRFAESSVGGRPLRHREEFTRSQVAALYAAVQAMPDSAKRRRLIRRFNRTNGGLPTCPVTQLGAAVAVKLDQTTLLSPASTLQSPPSPCFSSMLPSPPSPSPLPQISSPVFGSRVLLDFPMRCLSPGPEI